MRGRERTRKRARERERTGKRARERERERERARLLYLFAYCWGEEVHNTIDELVYGDIRIFGTYEQSIFILVVAYH